MSYADAGNAGFRHTSWQHANGGSPKTFLGKVRCLIEKIVAFEPIAADANNFPEARPVDNVDARVTLETLDNAMGMPETTTAGNMTMNFSEAGGTTGVGTVIGKMLAGSVTHTQQRRMGGFNVAQVFEAVGALTYTPTA